jgi:type IV pilus assembly protein PilE
MHTRGFSLIELAIALAIAAILAALALPSYQEHVRKGRRADAVSRLTLVLQAQERWRANRASYAGDLSDLGLPQTVDGGHYSLALASASADGYQATATPVAGSPQAGDMRCAMLSLLMRKGEIVYGSKDGGGGESTGPRNPCWSR